MKFSRDNSKVSSRANRESRESANVSPCESLRSLSPGWLSEEVSRFIPNLNMSFPDPNAHTSRQHRRARPLNNTATLPSPPEAHQASRSRSPISTNEEPLDLSSSCYQLYVEEVPVTLFSDDFTRYRIIQMWRSEIQYCIEHLVPNPLPGFPAYIQQNELDDWYVHPMYRHVVMGWHPAMRWLYGLTPTVAQFRNMLPPGLPQHVTWPMAYILRDIYRAIYRFSSPIKNILMRAEANCNQNRR